MKVTTRLTTLFSMAALALLSSLSPSGQVVEAQNATGPRAPTKVAGLPWWRVQQISKTQVDDDALIDRSNKLIFRDVKIDESSNEMTVQGVVNFQNRQGPIVGVNVSLELYYKHGRWQDTADMKHYTRIATANAATTVDSGLGPSQSRSIPAGLTSVSFKVPFEVPASNPNGGAAESAPSRRRIMPGEYQVKMFVVLNLQSPEVREKLLDPTYLYNREAIAKRQNDFLDDKSALIQLKKANWFDGENGRIWNDSFIERWNERYDEDGEVIARTPALAKAPRDLQSTFPGLYGEVVKHLETLKESWMRDELQRLERGEI
ncbi:MAG: hypothetical protein KDB07_06760, partial [Planctomycetes bacterium]|nr:hypothetical protein [Planctomycetota bacterium]